MSDVNLNMDFSRPVFIHGGSIGWTPSPQAGVDRRRLAREGAESGHATSFVRYAAGRSFPPHTHGAGEEYLVLEGVFSDESGDHGPGCYVRNPPGSSHAPYTEGGCTIFVKLCQMAPQGEPAVTVETAGRAWEAGDSPEHEVMPLHEDKRETVSLHRLDAGGSLPALKGHGGLETLVLDGVLAVNGEVFGPESWMRLPPGFDVRLSTSSGCRYWVKSGHLRDASL